MKKTASALVVAILPVMLLAPAADGQEPETPQIHTRQTFDCGVVEYHGDLGVVPEHQFVDVAARSNPVTIDVLVVYSAAAQSLGVDRIVGAFKTVNTILSNSRTRVSVRPVGIVAMSPELNVLASSIEDAGEDLSRLLNALPVDASVMRMRELAGADLVVGWTDSPKGWQARGLAHLPYRFSSTRGFSVVSTRDQSLGLVLAHELGHNFGLGHQNGTSGAGSYYARGKGYVAGGIFDGYGTVMSVSSPYWYANLLTFSRDGYFQGLRIGDASINASDALMAAAPEVAMYLSETSRSRKVSDTPVTQAWLHGEQFSVQIDFVDRDGTERDAKLLPASLGESAALFYFFNAANPEVLVKVLDGCSHNDHWWVFVAAATDQPMRVLVVPSVRSTSGWWQRDITWGHSDTRAFRCQ